MQENSPALELDKLRSYGLAITDFTLTQVVRQALESGILYNATQLRINMLENEVHKFPVVEFENFNDIRKISGMELIDEIQQSYQKTGIEETIVVTRSNYRANIYNQGIRSRVLMKEEELVNGDLLMVTKNNYFWSKPYDEIDFIANGDIVEVVRIRKQREMYGFRFADLTLRSLDYNWEIDARVWLDSLQSESPKSTRDLNDKLFQTVSEDYAEYTQKRTRIKKIYENEYFNALQVKFAYAVTCHKAQGGQWKKVYVDVGQVPQEQIDKNYYRWFYTALTRASEQVVLVNFPEK
jgi:exodeoxyribonuclease-5